MTRLVFETIDQFKKWIDDNVTKEKYEAYITPKKEVVLVPRKSTRPLKYGYAILTSEGTREIQRLLGEKGIKIYYAKVEWDETKTPGAEFAPPI
jgi:hypothetical protein